MLVRPPNTPALALLLDEELDETLEAAEARLEALRPEDEEELEPEPELEPEELDDDALLAA